MAYIDKDELQDYPFDGTFYKYNTDKTLPPSQQVAQEVIICNVKCDIQEGANNRSSTTVKAVYEIYVPFDSEANSVPVQRGDLFRGYQYGLLVAGRVIGVFPSQIGTFENYFTNPTDNRLHRCRGYLARVEATDV